MGILPAVGHLHDRGARLDPRAREREVELARLDEQARRGGRRGVGGQQRDGEREQRGAPHRTTFGRGIDAAARQHGAGVDAEPVGAEGGVEAAEVGRRAQVALRVERRQARELADHAAGRAGADDEADAGGAVVGADPFSSARRPNSDHTSVSTRSARPRASRSRWNANRLSAVSFRFCVSSVAWSAWVSHAPGALSVAQRIGRPAPSIAARPARRLGKRSSLCG